MGSESSWNSRKLWSMVSVGVDSERKIGREISALNSILLLIIMFDNFCE